MTDKKGAEVREGEDIPSKDVPKENLPYAPEDFPDNPDPTTDPRIPQSNPSN